MSQRTVYTHTDALGTFSIRSFDGTEQAELVHSWTSAPYAGFWMMGDLSRDEVAKFYDDMNASEHHECYLGFHQDKPCFLIELYDPRHEPVGETYSPREGDLGMHILVAPGDQPVHGFTSSVFHTLMAYLFSRDEVKRIVVEPDIRNHKIHRLNRKYGFRHERVIQMGDKSAWLAFCTREQFQLALASQNQTDQLQRLSQPELAVSPLDSEDVWARVNRLLIRKCLTELSHERILSPSLITRGDAGGHYRIQSDDDNVAYEFDACLLPLEHWLIETDSIKKLKSGAEAPLDALAFVIEFSQTMGISQKQLPTYLEEISATLYSSAYKHSCDWLPSSQLASADFQTIEAAMTEGHPGFIANNGRIGFDANDFPHYVPEAGAPVRLIWVAAHKDRATFSAGQDMSYQQLLDQEFDPTTLAEFNRQLQDKGLNPDDYLLMPVHPWQWYNKLAHVYAADIATCHIVCLGYSDDAYQAQQSIRTFFNRSNPEKFYVKTALSVLNMGFMRGLSAAYMKVTPAINDWLYDLISKDQDLQANGFGILREIASVGYSNPTYENDLVGDSPYKKMLAGLWRESPMKLIEPDEKLMTMAALLHVDPAGKALVTELIAASPLDTDQWIQSYLKAYLTPLLHCYFKYSLVYMPHGENLILVMKNNVPVRVFMKDIGEEICLLNTDCELPEQVKRIAVTVPEDFELLSFFMDVFDCFFRFLTAILFEDSDYQPENFWELVARCVQDYQDAHPEFAAKYQQHDLFKDTFSLSCLNRLQLANNQQMIDLTDPSKLLQFAGVLQNPIAPFRQGSQR